MLSLAGQYSYESPSCTPQADEPRWFAGTYTTSRGSRRLGYSVSKNSAIIGLTVSTNEPICAYVNRPSSEVFTSGCAGGVATGVSGCAGGCSAEALRMFGPPQAAAPT